MLRESHVAYNTHTIQIEWRNFCKDASSVQLIQIQTRTHKHTAVHIHRMMVGWKDSFDVVEGMQKINKMTDFDNKLTVLPNFILLGIPL